MQKKVHKLKDFYPDEFQLIVIAAHQSDYRLTWALNKKMNWNLKKTADLKIRDSRTSQQQHFARYAFHDQQGMDVHLIGNKSQQGFLIPSLTNIDFLLKVSHMDDEKIHQIIQRIRQIDFVITAFKLDNLKAQDKKKLNF